MEKSLREKLKNIKLILSIYKVYRKAENSVYIIRTRERHIRKGRNTETPYFIVRRFRQAGFFSNYFYVLGKIIYAKKNGYHVVVDMENYDSLYKEDHPVAGVTNAWEYYFHQPEDISLREAYCSGNYILSSDKYIYDKVPFYEGKNRRFPDQVCLSELQPYVEKYMRIKPKFIEKANLIFDEIIGNREVLGLHIRGTDMRTTANHPVPAGLDTYFSAIDSMLISSKIEKILLCTDEEQTITEMRKRYPEKVVCTNSFRSDNGESIHTGHRNAKRENHRYMLGEEVLLDALLLSKCDYLLCGHSNVAYAAIVFNGGNYKRQLLIENKSQDKNIQIDDFTNKN